MPHLNTLVMTIKAAGDVPLPAPFARDMGWFSLLNLHARTRRPLFSVEWNLLRTEYGMKQPRSLI